MTDPNLHPYLGLVLSSRADGESNVESNLHAALLAMGYTSAETQYQTGAGPADIAIPDQGIFVEVKKRGEAGPDLPGRQEDETQKGQLTRYVRAWQARERESAQHGLFASTETALDKSVCGVLTDGRLWWVWRFSDADEPHLESAVPLNSGQESLLETLLRGLGNPDARTIPAAADLAPQLRPMRERLEKLYRNMRDWLDSSVLTKYSVWKDLLRASGMPPDEDLASALFVDHTFLVVLARMVAGLLADEWNDPPDPANREGFPAWIWEGFPAWVWESDEGAAWVADLYSVNAVYDWRRAPGDTLRDLYMAFVDSRHRKVFGEYYTPDWLAAELASRILDDEWLAIATERALTPGASAESLAGTGVLDPACGSGTFLFHAARRILAYLEKDGYLTDQKRADAVVHLVHGLDIHPVAVEMARATLLSALPTAPTEGRDALQIFQGDALRVSRQADAGLFREGGQYSLVPTGNIQDGEIPLPMAFLKRPDRIKSVQDFVTSADKGDLLPIHLTYGLEPGDKTELEAAHQTLAEVCQALGDSIWAWYILNTVAPFLLAERKVDRILANPPWVRLSDIQDPKRKEEMEALADELHLWAGGQRATGFDIAQIFAVRCSELYLPLPDTRNWGGRTAWLVNAASMRSGTWKHFRERTALRSALCLDFSQVRQKPFHGADCAAWLTGADNSLLGRQRLVMRSGERVRRQDAWETVATKTRWEAMPDPPPEAPSAWLNDKGKPLARNGATLFPHVLVRIAIELPLNRDLIDITTHKSNKGAWKSILPRKGEVPRAWIRDVVFSRDLLTFALRPRGSRMLLPIDDTGEWDPMCDQHPFWQELEKLYARHRGKGKATPRTLKAQLDHQAKLRKQFPLPDRSTWVVYNGSGASLRAARCKGMLIEHGCYRVAARSPDEAAFLVALLNADCMQNRLHATMETDRHFDTHFWHKVPLPRLVPDNPDHQSLVQLALQCEQAALEWLETADISKGQITLSNGIRTHLRITGLSAELDAAVKDLLSKLDRK